MIYKPSVIILKLDDLEFPIIVDEESFEEAMDIIDSIDLIDILELNDRSKIPHNIQDFIAQILATKNIEVEYYDMFGTIDLNKNL